MVANGGIATDPRDRTRLKIAKMRQNLTLLSAEGAILAQVDVPDTGRAAIRHLAVTDAGVAFAMESEGDPAEVVPLPGLRDLAGAPVLCPVPEGEAERVKGYAGTIARARRMGGWRSPRQRGRGAGPRRGGRFAGAPCPG